MKYILILCLFTTCVPARKSNGNATQDSLYKAKYKIRVLSKSQIEGYYKSGGCHLGGPAKKIPAKSRD